MLNYILAAIQLILIGVIITLFLQIQTYIKKLPDDEVLGEERANFIVVRLDILKVCIYAEIAVILLKFILHFI